MSLSETPRPFDIVGAEGVRTQCQVINHLQ